MSRRHGWHAVATCRRKLLRRDIRVTMSLRLIDVVGHDFSYFLVPSVVEELWFVGPRLSQLPNGICIEPRSLSLKPLFERFDVFFRDAKCLHQFSDALEARGLVGSDIDGFGFARRWFCAVGRGGSRGFGGRRTA